MHAQAAAGVSVRHSRVLLRGCGGQQQSLPLWQHSNHQQPCRAAAVAAAAAATGGAPAAARSTLAAGAGRHFHHHHYQQPHLHQQQQQQQQRRGIAAAAAAAAPGAATSDTWLIVGLGNPGPRYEKTRHNVGFMVVDSLARQAGIDLKKLEKSAAVGRGTLHGRRVILAKPVTFMNNSGESVAALARFYKIPHQQVLVIADDLDQPTAAVRLRLRGGHGGHNGLRSIIQHLGGTHDFPRLKIGIGRPEGQLDVASYVLQEFRRAEMEAIEGAIAECHRVIDACLSLGLQKALSGSRL